MISPSGHQIAAGNVKKTQFSSLTYLVLRDNFALLANNKQIIFGLVFWLIERSRCRFSICLSFTGGELRGTFRKEEKNTNIFNKNEIVPWS